MKGIKFKAKGFFIGLSIIFLMYILINNIISNITCDAKNYFSGKSRGKTVERRLRYGTYNIWEKLHEVRKCSFEVEKYPKDKNKAIGFSIEVSTIKIVQDIKTIIKNDLITLEKNDLKKLKHGRVKFKKNYKKNITINGNYAIIVSYSYDLNKTDNFCYIVIPDHIIRIKSYGLTDFVVRGSYIWEAFYTSFKTDFSQNYKINSGSFNITDEFYDLSAIWYKLDEMGTYEIEINYVNKEITNPATNLEFFTKSKFVNQQKITIDGKEALYEEIEHNNDRDGMILRSKMAVLTIYGIKPGLRIIVSSNDSKSFEFYRGEMESFFKSINFDE